MAKEIDSNIIKKTCKDLGLTYRELGEAIGYSENAISNASRAKVSLQMQKAIEMYLEIIKLKKKLNECESLKTTLNSFLDRGDG